MNIFFVGLSGVPYLKRASDTRLFFFAQIMTSKGNQVTIINKRPTKANNEEYNLKNFEIIELFNLQKKHSRLNQILIYIISYFKEFFYLVKANKKNKIDILHLYSGHFIDFLHYYVIAKLIRAKIVYQYVEMRSNIERKGVYHKINGYLVDQFGCHFFNGIISISNYIDNHIKQRFPKSKTIKIPPVCNFDYFNSVVNFQINDNKKPYLLFCGSAGYIDVIKLIYDSYIYAPLIKKTFSLKLILNGTKEQLDAVVEYTDGDADILSNLTYEGLILEYKNAEALLIPLRNTIQDIARFPNKIGEYTACSGLILTTNFGEIRYFFKDSINALIADEFSAESFGSKILSLCEMKDDEKRKIKSNAYQLGNKSFDIHNYDDNLQTFLTTLSK